MRQKLKRLQRNLYDETLEEQLDDMIVSARTSISDDAQKKFEESAKALLMHVGLPFLIPEKLEITDDRRSPFFEMNYEPTPLGNVLRPTPFAGYDDRSSTMLVHEALFPGTKANERYVNELERSLSITERLAKDSNQPRDLREGSRIFSEMYRSFLTMYTTTNDEILEASIVHELGHGLINVCGVHDIASEYLLGDPTSRMAEEGLVTLLTKQVTGYEMGDNTTYHKFMTMTEETLERDFGTEDVADLLRTYYESGLNGLRTFGRDYLRGFRQTVSMYTDQNGRLRI